MGLLAQQETSALGGLLLSATVEQVKDDGSEHPQDDVEGEWVGDRHSDCCNYCAATGEFPPQERGGHTEGDADERRHCRDYEQG